MKPVFIATQISVVICIFIMSYYMGRPVYWSIVSRTSDRISQGDVITEDKPVKKAEGARNQEDMMTENAEGARSQEIKPAKNAKKAKIEQSNDRFWEKEIWKQPLEGTKMPPLEDFDLTNEMVQYRAKDNVIVVTFANHAFLDFVITWVKHLTELKVFNILVGAMDAEILEALYWEGVPVFNMESNMNTIDVGWGTAAFHKMGREKVILVNKFLSFGVELLMCDTDMVWLKILRRGFDLILNWEVPGLFIHDAINSIPYLDVPLNWQSTTLNPLPYFARFPEADVLVSSDEVVNSVDDDSLEIWERSHGAYNIGIFHWRPTEASKKFALDWRKQLLEDEKIWDQNGFNELMRKKTGPSVNDTGLFYSYDGTLKLGILPVSIFCSGHTYFVQALSKQLGLEAYAIHTTFQFAGTPGKRHRLREAKAFYDKPSYYDSPGGFLSFRPHIPKELLAEGRNSVEDHFKLLNYQIKQIKDALAIASLLGRSLVMPKLWCRLDRLWFGHPGVLPGTKTKQPFVCPMDHVFEVNNMLSKYDEAVFGSPIGFREYSFLDNPRLPKQVSESKLKVKLCNRDAEDCTQNAEGRVDKVYLPRNGTDEEMISVLSPFTEVKVIEFSSMKYAFGGFTDKVREQKFRTRVNRYTGIWCCLEHIEIGHIYYDMYWEEKPRWKPLPPRNREEDHPPF